MKCFVPLSHFSSPKWSFPRIRTLRRTSSTSLSVPRGARPDGLTIGDGPELRVEHVPPEQLEQRDRFREFLDGAFENRVPLAVDLEATGKDPHASGFAVRLWSVSDGLTAFVVDARDDRSCGLVHALLSRYPHTLLVHNGFAYDFAVAVRELGVDVGVVSETRARTAPDRHDAPEPARPPGCEADRAEGDVHAVFRRRCRRPGSSTRKGVPKYEGGLGVDRRDAPRPHRLRRRRRCAHTAAARTAPRGGRLRPATRARAPRRRDLPARRPARVRGRPRRRGRFRGAPRRRGERLEQALARAGDRPHRHRCR